MQNYQPNGKHVLVDGAGCNFDVLNNGKLLASVLRQAAIVAGATVLNVHTELFKPNGVSVAVVLSESHITIHTYPEQGVFMADVFTCGQECQPDKAANYIIEQLKCTDVVIKEIIRGKKDLQ